MHIIDAVLRNIIKTLATLLIVICCFFKLSLANASGHGSFSSESSPSAHGSGGGGGEHSSSSSSGHGSSSSHGGEKAIPVEDKSAELLSEIREGDFSHIGGPSAINRLLEAASMPECEPAPRNANSLEIGCGFGGSAGFIKSSGYDNLWGIDINQKAIDLAKEKYSGINFINADATKLAHKFQRDFFSYIFMLNTAYAIKEKNALWQSIKQICENGAILAILDYNLGHNVERGQEGEFAKSNGEKFYPINLEETKKIFNYIGWDIIKIEDITDDFKLWHKELIDRINDKRDLLMSAGYSEDQIGLIYNNITNFLNLINEGKLGGVIIIAKKR